MGFIRCLFVVRSLALDEKPQKEKDAWNPMNMRQWAHWAREIGLIPSYTCVGGDESKKDESPRPAELDSSPPARVQEGMSPIWKPRK